MEFAYNLYGIKVCVNEMKQAANTVSFLETFSIIHLRYHYLNQLYSCFSLLHSWCALRSLLLATSFQLAHFQSLQIREWFKRNDRKL